MRFELSQSELQELEGKLRTDPEDFDSRLKVLEYLGSKRYTDDSVKSDLFRHIYWVIENDPGNDVLHLPYACVDKVLDEEYVPRAVELYEQALAAHPDNARVVSNTGWFYQRMDDERAEELLKRCCELEPENEDYQSRLGLFYSVMLRSIAYGQYPGRDVAEVSRLAYFAYQKAFDLLEPDKIGQFYRMPDLAMSAYRAGFDKQASGCAGALIAAARYFEGDWNFGNALHKGNIILGLLALRNGDIDSACEHLLKAGDNPGSPQLNSFGPDLELAQLLLNAGRHQCVVEYMKLCRKFHEDQCGFYERALPLIEAGETPNLEGLKHDDEGEVDE